MSNRFFLSWRRANARRVSTSVAVAVALVLSACSSGSDATDSAESGSSAPTVTPVETTQAPVTTTKPAGSAVDDLELPTDATQLAEAINDAELAIVDPATPTDELPAWGRRQQVLYQVLDLQRDWSGEVTQNLDPAVSSAFELNWTAKQSLSSLVKSENLHSSLPAWRLIEPDPADELLGYYKEAESETGIDWEYVAAINLVETRMGRIEGVSTAGAVGPMQFLPSTWEGCCEGDPRVTRDAIVGAAKYLTIRGGPQNMDKAIFGYNNSQFYVDAVTAYASVLRADEQAYYAYHGWEIFFRTSGGLIHLPADYEQAAEVPVSEWLEENPETLFPGSA